MPLPPRLLQAVSSPGGGRIALVLGAGCSVEAPTNMPISSRWSNEVHRRLVADGILLNNECTNPEDLSAVADAVFAKHGSQREIVERLRDSRALELATPNEGYLIAAALLCEGAISSVVILNYDLAFKNALSQLGTSRAIEIGIIEHPEDLNRQTATNVYYLHHNVNERNSELWVLRTVALAVEWIGHWEQIIAARVLIAPVVLFAGLGTRIAVLVESTRLLRAALPRDREFYLADPGDMANSAFFQALEIDAHHYIQLRWVALMKELSERLLMEQIDKLDQAAKIKLREDGLQNEDIAHLLARLQELGLITAGRLRAQWLLDPMTYRIFEENSLGLVADLILALATIGRISNAAPVILEDGCVEYMRQDRIVVCFIVASGSGHRGRNAIEAELQSRRSKYRHNPTAVLVGGTSASWQGPLSPPADIISGEVSREDLLRGPATMSYFHIDELRADQARIMKVVP